MTCAEHASPVFPWSRRRAHAYGLNEDGEAAGVFSLNGIIANLAITGPGEIRVKVSACGVCRTDLHVVDGELPNPTIPIIPGHEIVGRIDLLGADVKGLELGERVGIPWLGHACGVCPYCLEQRENLCDHPLFTGYTRNGGFATMVLADARFAFPLGETGSDVSLAPLLCAGLIGGRSLVIFVFIFAGGNPHFVSG